MGRGIRITTILIITIAVIGCRNPLLDIIRDHVVIHNSVVGVEVQRASDDELITEGGTHTFSLIGTSRTGEATFTIANTGELDITIEGTVSVQNATLDGVFSVIQQPPATIAAGESADFIVEYAPSQPGNCSAEIVIPYSITESAEYTFTVAGSAVFRGLKMVDNIGTLYGYAAGMGDMIVSGDNIIICYYDSLSSGHLRIARSTNGGYSWNNSPLSFGSGADYECSLALSGTTLYMAYRNAADDIMFARSPDLGSTWDSTDIDTSAYTGSTSGSISLDAYDDTINIGFEDGGARLVRSFDRGETWDASTLLNSNAGAGTPSDLVSSNGQCVLAYYDMTDHGTVFERYGTYGSTGTHLESSQNDSGGTGVGVAQYNNHVYGVFAGEYVPGGAPDFAVFFQHSSDGGGSWLDSPVAVEYAGLDNFFPSVATNGTYVYVCYLDNTNNRLSFQRSGDHGANWDSDTVVDRVVDDSTSMSGYYNVIRTDGDYVYVAYFDSNELWLAKSMDCGVTW